MDKNDFHFTFKSNGRYKVTYTSPKTGKKFTTELTDMELIHKTKNVDSPKVKDLNTLKFICKQN